MIRNNWATMSNLDITGDIDKILCRIYKHILSFVGILYIQSQPTNVVSLLLSPIWAARAIMVGSITSEVAQEILQQRNEVVADKVKEKRDREYVEKKRRYLGFTTRDGQFVCSGDAGSMARLREHPEVLEILKDILNGGNKDDDFGFESNEEIQIPPCPFPLGVKERTHS